MTPTGNGAPASSLLTIKETAALLRLSGAKVYEMAAKGELPGAVRFGRAIRVQADVLHDWLRSQAA